MANVSVKSHIFDILTVTEHEDVDTRSSRLRQIELPICIQSFVSLAFLGAESSECLWDPAQGRINAKKQNRNRLKIVLVFFKGSLVRLDRSDHKDLKLFSKRSESVLPKTKRSRYISATEMG